MSSTADFVIAGAGVIGLAVAREIRRRHANAKIIVLEKEGDVGLHASGRNSGVLHSGIYYTPGTLKAKFCGAGARQMREFARIHGVPCRTPGKIILSSGAEDESGLDRLMANAEGNGIQAERIDADRVRDIEPHAAKVPGILCRDTGVIDSKAVLKALVDELKKSGVEFRHGARGEVLGANESALRVRSGESVSFGFFFNCAGARADRLAKLFGLGEEFVLVPFKGIYYSLKPERAHLVRESIYPVPDLRFPFLGIHLTRNVSGDVYVGPTAIPAFGSENYGFIKGVRCAEFFSITGHLCKMYFSRDPQFRRLVHHEVAHYFKNRFLAAAQRLVPALTPEDLRPSAKVGVRPQLVRRKDARLEMDFVIEKTARSVHVLNAISPAFTCAFPFSRFVVEGAVV